MKERTSNPLSDVAVVYEDDDLAVIDKPSGLLVHAARPSDRVTLAVELVRRWPQLARVGEAPERPGIMHRLDKEASGLMVVAKNQAAYDDLKRQFQTHEIKKEYLVLVHGRPSKDEGVVSLTIGRAGGRMAARPQGGQDRAAVTHYTVVERYRKAALLRVRTETGRTHQIRVHMQALGHPVVGDPLYKIRRQRPLPAPRLFLHAAQLGFRHPRTGAALEFNSPLPDELQRMLINMKLV